MSDYSIIPETNNSVTTNLAKQLHLKVLWCSYIFLTCSLVLFVLTVLIYVLPGFYLTALFDPIQPDTAQLTRLRILISIATIPPAILYFLLCSRLRESAKALQSYLLNGSVEMLNSVIYHQYRYFRLNILIALIIPAIMVIVFALMTWAFIVNMT